ncbi:Ig-like domain-containing protein [Demequina iriomotensis]|uniref:Ig-like domain-containing protein n=1 Tax=Demequina iriomotensis TaxID=1536641 RepID=UPI000781C202|nr:Ig-like domain-containing protein [Demequina iriomotensis]
MRAWGTTPGRGRATGVIAAVLALGLVVGVAVVYDGVPAQELELNDAGIWVTNDHDSLLGRVNEESRVIDAALAQSSGGLDVLQEGAMVLAHSIGSHTLSLVDPATVTATGTAALPLASDVSLGGGRLSVLDAESGSLWVMAADAVATFDAESSTPAVTLGDGAVAVASQSGVVYGASAELGVVRIDQGDAESPEPSVTPQPRASSPDGAAALGARLAATTVGDTLVILDVEAGTLTLPEGAVEVDDPETTVLQQPGPDADAVVYADSSGLVSQPLDGSPATRVSLGDASGVAAAPAVLGDCAYGAWGAANLFVRDCGDDAADTGAVEIPGAPADSAYAFRVNRDLIRLNDLPSGTTWTAASDLEIVDNWDDFAGTEDQKEKDPDTEEITPLIEDRDPKNTPPVANDDEFGARVGRTTILPILDNDYDRDADVLTASIVDTAGAKGLVIQPIRDGAAVQVTVPEGASGHATFSYRVEDGRGGTDEAVVDVRLATADENSAPVQRAQKTPSFTVEVDGTFTYNVLPAWIDPEGDTIYLESATVENGDTVEFAGDGTVTYRATSGRTGRTSVAIEVSDGVESAPGRIDVTVVESGTGDIVTNADQVTTHAGEAVVVRPLENDYSPSGEPLRLASLDTTEAAGASVEPHYDSGYFTFEADRAGTYYVLYGAVLGQREPAQGIVRIDVLADEKVTEPPIAVQDTALVPAGGSVLADVLANDSDPGGGVLVLQSVTVPDGAGISVAVLEHRILRVTNVTGITTPVTVRYRVSNGAYQSEGELVVIPVPADARSRAPLARDDDAVVRAGDVVTVDVLDNDTHPDGFAFGLDAEAPLPNLKAENDPRKGEAFVSGDAVRFVAAAGASGTQTVTYQVTDTNGQKATARVTLKIVAKDAENTAPRPAAVVARTIAGTTVRIPIELDGADPDGDTVTLSGIDEAPAKGRIVEVGQSWLTYEAYPTSVGGDSFTYVVRDTRGLEGTATVRVGIAPQEEANQPPVAVADDVRIRPGGTVAVSALANDSDPDGHALSLVDGSLIASEGLEAEVDGSRIVITAGDPGTGTVQYAIRDELGSSAFGVVRVTVDPAAPLARPIARDDRVTFEEITGVETVDVAVLANDDDPDGVLAGLAIDVDPLAGTVNDDGTVTVTPGEQGQVIRYTVTDPDGLSDSAFILVPGAGDGRPTLKQGAGIEILSGDSITVRLGDLVATSNGRPAILTAAERVRASFGDGSPLVVDERTLTYTSKDGYYGPDALTFEVTDGATVDDPSGRVSRLTVPITVLPRDNVPPTLVGATLQLGQGEDAASLPLAPLARDANPEDADVLSFALGEGVPRGVEAAVTDGVLTVTAPGAVKGDVFEIPVTVTDGRSAPVGAVVTASVVASARPLAATVDDAVADAVAGKPVTVHPLDGDFNPFADKGPLTLISAAVESGDAAYPVIDGDTVTITPTADTYGTVVVKYAVQDYTEDPTRIVEGRIRVTVAARPDAPSRPRIVAVGDSEVTLEWDAPDSRGSAITGYTVYASDGSSKTADAGLLTYTGLDNATSYTFQVSAANAKGESDRSAASESATPDIVPEQPGAPTLAFGDGEVAVTWAAPGNRGSALEGYTLEVSPATVAPVQAKAGATSAVIDALENGVAYQVRLLATNEAGDSAWSEYSASEVPAGAPFAAAAPSAALLEQVGERRQVEVTWSEADGNGDPVSSYDLNVYQGATLVKSTVVEGGATSAIIEVETSESLYSFAVVGHNKAPEAGAESAQSAALQVVNPPGAPLSVTATTPASDGKITVAYTPGPRNGATVDQVSYQYELNGNGAWTAMPAGGVIGPLTAGTSYTVAVRAVSVVAGVTYTGPASTPSLAAVPYTPIGTATITATPGTNTVTFRVTAPSPTNGRAITSIAVCTTKSTSTSCTPATVSGFTSGSKDIAVTGLSDGQSAAIKVVVTATESSNTSTATKTSAAVDPPDPTATLKKSSNRTSTSTCSYYGGGGCYFMSVTTQDFPAGTYTYACFENGVQFTDASNNPLTFSMSFPANGTVQTVCYAGLARTYSVKIYGVDGSTVTTPGVAW